LIAGANTGAAKTSKARELGTEVIDEACLLELLGDAANVPPQESAPPAEAASGKLEQGMLF
jgi:BRCT domain type II-containing protein